MKIKNFMKYFKEGVLKYLKIPHEIFSYFKVKYFIVHPTSRRKLRARAARRRQTGKGLTQYNVKSMS